MYNWKLTAFFHHPPTHISWAVRMETNPEIQKFLQRKITLTLLAHLFWKAYFMQISDIQPSSVNLA